VKKKTLIISLVIAALLCPLAYYGYKKLTYVELPLSALYGENKLSECEYVWFIYNGNSSANDVMQKLYDEGKSEYTPRQIGENMKSVCPDLDGEMPDYNKGEKK